MVSRRGSRQAPHSCACGEYATATVGFLAEPQHRTYLPELVLTPTADELF